MPRRCNTRFTRDTTLPLYSNSKIFRSVKILNVYHPPLCLPACTRSIRCTCAYYTYGGRLFFGLYTCTYREHSKITREGGISSIAKGNAFTHRRIPDDVTPGSEFDRRLEWLVRWNDLVSTRGGFMKTAAIGN